MCAPPNENAVSKFFMFELVSAIQIFAMSVSAITKFVMPVSASVSAASKFVMSVSASMSAVSKYFMSVSMSVSADTSVRVHRSLVASNFVVWETSTNKIPGKS